MVFQTQTLFMNKVGVNSTLSITWAFVLLIKPDYIWVSALFPQ